MRVSNENLQAINKLESNTVNTFTYKNKNNINTGIACRDPFILLYNGEYYLYKSTWENIVVFKSDDLISWSDEKVVFSASKDFYGIDDMFWAPECHYYNGKFYIFTSCLSRETNKRRITILVSDSPDGKFIEYTVGGISPKDWHSIDGTLYIEDGVPYMIFVHEWVDMADKNGSFVYARLSSDLKEMVDLPKTMFYAKELKDGHGVTDGCYPVKLSDGTLMLIWSNYVFDSEYVIAKAISDNGKLDGKWEQKGLLYKKGISKEFLQDGGHGMIFLDKNNEHKLCFHSPNFPIDNKSSLVKIATVIEKDKDIIIK